METEKRARQPSPSVAILDIGRGDDGVQRQPLCIDQDMPLLAFDLLARVISVWVDMSAALFRTLDALSVDDCSGRTGLPWGLLSAFDVERVMNSLQRAIPTPAVEVVIHRAACRQILKDRTPLTAGAEDVHQPVHHLAEVDRALGSARLGRRDERRDLRPLITGQVAFISQPTTVVAATVLLGPHRAPPKTARGN